VTCFSNERFLDYPDFLDRWLVNLVGMFKDVFGYVILAFLLKDVLEFLGLVGLKNQFVRYPRLHWLWTQNVLEELTEAGLHCKRRPVEPVVHVLEFLLRREADGGDVDVESRQCHYGTAKLKGYLN